MTHVPPSAPPVVPGLPSVLPTAAPVASAAERDLAIGRAIQTSFLPSRLPEWPGWELAAVSEPARQVSGDFYDVFPLAGGMAMGAVVGDVCGKGVGAALFMALFRTLIRAIGTEVVRSGMTVLGRPDTKLVGALHVANDYIADVHGSANMFATVFAAAVQPFTGHVWWVNAGHDPALVLDATGAVRARLAPNGPALGLFPGVTLETGVAMIAPGETLLVTTDGVSEARDPAGGFFGDDRLVALCAGGPPAAGALVRRVTDAVRTFAAGAEAADDLTLLALHRTPLPR